MYKNIVEFLSGLADIAILAFLVGWIFKFFFQQKTAKRKQLNKAKKDLESKSASVRISAVHVLLQLAKEDKILRSIVLNILCFHIRQTTSSNKYRKKYKEKPSEEIQEILSLTFVQEHDVFKDCFINLKGSYLNGADLNQARLKKANLVRARLQHATLSVAQLQGADLTLAELQEAFFNWAELQGAILMGSQFQCACLMGSKMQGSILLVTRLQGANLTQAQLQGANLCRAQLQGADLTATQLQGIRSQDCSLPFLEFESRIKCQIDTYGDLTEVIFSGGLQHEDLDILCRGLSAENDKLLRAKLINQVGEQASNKLPQNSSAVIDTYTKREAEKWIAEYNKGISIWRRIIS